jgi:hypothetical protein
MPADRHDLARARALMTARRLAPECPLDLGIAHVVDLLQQRGAPLGVGLVESCDASPGHCYPDPTVRIVGSPGAAWHAVAILLDHALPLRDLAQVWPIGPTGPSGPPVWDLRFRPEVTGGLVTPVMDEWVLQAKGDDHG